jgi:Sec-independent protein secretion pathway component TatC
VIYVLVFRIAAVLSPPTLPRFHLFVFNVLFFILFRIPIRLCPASKSEGEKERKGKEREGKERKGKERKGKERKGKERKGKDRKGYSDYSVE